MCKITSGGYNTGVTVLSNLFVDNFMPDASGSNLKVYIYILRYAYIPSAEITLKGIAELLDLTPKAVVKSLKYWQDAGLLNFTLNETGDISRIHLNDIYSVVTDTADKSSLSAVATETNTTTKGNAAIEANSTDNLSSDSLSDTLNTNNRVNSDNDTAGKTNFDNNSESNAISGSPSVTAINNIVTEEKTVALPTYSTQEILSFSRDKHFKGLLSYVEAYLAPNTIKAEDVNTLAAIVDSLKFSDELTLHLYDYCCSKGKRDYKYIQTVASNWATKNVKTIDDAKIEEQFHDDFLISIRKSLGMTRGFGSKQLELIELWLYNYRMKQELILEACNRACLQEVEKPFAYAAKTIEAWHGLNLRTMEDVLNNDKIHKDNLEKEYQDKKRNSNRKQAPAYNQFNDFEQRTISDEEDAALGKMLLSKGATKERRDAFSERLANAASTNKK